jgi:lysozyme
MIAAALAGCAGGIGEIAEPSALTGHHPFPLREASPGFDLHEVHGIDISKYQGEIDWQAVKGAGIGFAFIKATEGTDLVDRRFQANWAGAKAAGVARGAYHFSYWCTPMAAQFENFRRIVPVEPDSMPPVLDLEWNHQSPTCPKKVPKEQALAEIRTWVQLAERHYGKKPILYVEIPFYRDVLSGGEFSDYPLWLRSVAAPPQVRYPGRRWAFWQYTDKGRVAGIGPRVDKNVFAGTRAEWQRLVASNFSHQGTATAGRPSSPPASPAAPAPTLVATTPAATAATVQANVPQQGNAAAPAPAMPAQQASR